MSDHYNKYCFFFFLFCLGLTFKLCLKDLSDQIAWELTSRLESDPVAQKLFYQSFGLDRLHAGALSDISRLHPDSLFEMTDISWPHPGVVISDIRELFPDTPIRLLKDIFESLKLYDLVELLEKAKPRTLRPALPLKEIEKLPNSINRPTKFYSNAEVLIIDGSTRAADDNAERIGSFFKSLNSRNKVTAITVGSIKEIIKDLIKLNRTKEYDELEQREYSLNEKLDEYAQERELLRRNMKKQSKTDKRFEGEENLLRLVDKRASLIEMELEKVIEKRKQREKEPKPEIEKTIEQKKEELQKEKEKFQMAVSTVMDRWVQNEGK